MDQNNRSPLKRVSLVFLTITALGLTSSWLSSCSETAAAAGDHASIENQLTRIELKIGNPGKDTSTNVSTMAGLTSKLSDDIGKMADKIVETEKLIVQVITNQTSAATTTISLLTTNDGQELFPGYSAAPMPYVLDSILKGSAASSVALKTPATVSVTASIPPSIASFGNPPLKNYIIVVSLDATFASSVQREINTAAPAAQAGSPADPTNLGVAWNDLVGIDQLNLTQNGNVKVFVAIKSLNTTTGGVSGLSNSVAFTFN